jgi:1,4-alpha-glucan branching enzyme
MHKLESAVGWLNAKNQYIYYHEKDKLIVIERGDLLFIFNFHPTQSFEHYRIGTKWGSDHIILLESDDTSFGGKERLKYGRSNFFPFHNQKWNNRNNYIQLYIPSRTAIVMIAEENIEKYNLNDYLDKDLLSSRKMKKSFNN